jgi:alkyldihydroxyacetonephosphate synthase
VSAAGELRQLLGAERVLTGPDELAARAGDLTPRALIARRAGRPLSPPAAVVRPRSTADVARVLAWADEARAPVVPFGGGSSVVDSIRAEGAVVVDLTALDTILGLDETSQLVTCQAGVMGPALDDYLRARGYLLGHEPQSIALSTVGGWIATRACGQLSARYGGIENLLAGFTAVLAGGRVVVAKTVPRRAAGPDVAGLLVGSEGTLGIVTEATLRVSPLPAGRADACLRFEHMADAVAACRMLAQGELRPTLVRLYDPEDAALLLRSWEGPEAGDPRPLLLLSFDGDDAAARAEGAMAGCGGEPANAALVAHWWQHRNDAAHVYLEVMAGKGLLGPHGVIDTIEVAGTWTVLRALYHSIKDALSPLALLCGCHLSHVYRDGACLYFTLAGAAEDDDGAAALDRSWWEAAMRACLDAGGTISHHHGIGRLKAPWLEEELGGWYEVLRAVKRALDPHGIMNPGALGL